MSIKYNSAFFMLLIVNLLFFSCKNSTESEPNSLELQLTPTHVSTYGGSDGSIDLTVTSGNEPYQYEWSNGETTEDISNLTAGTYSITVTDAIPQTNTKSETITQPDLPTPTVTLDQLYELNSGAGPVYSLAWSPNSSKIATASYGNIKLWNIDSGTILDTLQGHSSYVWGVSWSPDGNKIASASQDGTVRLWNSSTNENIATFNTGWAFCVAWSPDGERLVSGNSSDNIRIWDTNVDTLVSSYSLDEESSFPGTICIGWSNNANTIAAGYWSGTILILDSESGSILIVLNGYTSARSDVNGLAWSPDGKILATAHQDGKIRLWNSTTGEQINTLIGHTSWVRGVAWSPDGTMIATTSEDRGLFIWHAETGKLLASRKKHTRPVWSVAWSPDGNKIATGGGVYDSNYYSGEIFIWSITISGD